jgi:serine/threonine-protein kinase ATR
MVHRSHERKKSKWSELFYACRGALRTQAGLGVAELLLPILVLDCLCYGNGHDEKVLLNEIVRPLIFDNTDSSRMNRTERQKAVNIVFNMIDLFQLWSETETENRHKKSRRNLFVEVSNKQGMTMNIDEWPIEESVMRIDDMIKEISYEFRSNAAANVGMFAYALRLQEMNSRSLAASDVFDGTSNTTTSQYKSRAGGKCPPEQLNFMKDVLAKLDDFESLIALGEDDFWSNPDTRLQDSIRRNESLGNWQAALNDYDQLTTVGSIGQRQLGSLRCLLSLGHFESVLHQVNGILKHDEINEDETIVDINQAIPIAVEAAWRLGKWDKIESLIELGMNKNKPYQATSCRDAYQICLGSIMMHANTRNLTELHTSLRQARRVIVDDLSSVSRESYTRAYNAIVNLHAIREVEDVAEFLCSKNSGSTFEEIVSERNLAWESRLDLVSPAEAVDVINTRIALARLASDRAYESSMFLNMGSRARKSGFHGIAANALAQAEFVLSDAYSSKDASLMSGKLQYQFAKLKHDCGESSVALRILEPKAGGSFGFNAKNEISERGFSIDCNKSIQEGQKKINDVFLRSLLQSTRWMIEGGLKGCNEIMSQFKNIHNESPRWEKGHFHYAKYIDSVLRTRVMELEKRSIERYSGSDEDLLRSRVISSDRTCQKYVLVAMKHYAHALSLDMKHLYHALPRKYWHCCRCTF